MFSKISQKHQTPLQLLEMEIQSNPTPLEISKLSEIRQIYLKKVQSSTRFKGRTVEHQITLDLPKEFYISFVSPYGEISTSRGRRIHKFRSPQSLELCPLLRGLPFTIKDPYIENSNEINRVIYMCEQEEQKHQANSGIPRSTVSATYTPGYGRLSFKFWTSYENSETGICFDGPRLGVLSYVASNPTVLIRNPSNLSIPAITVTPIPQNVPPFPPISQTQNESYWNQLVQCAQNLGLNKFQIELIANEVKSTGINLPQVNEICSNSFYDFNVKRTRKRKISEIEEDSDFN